MKLIKWFRDGAYLEHATLVTFTVFIFCCGIGLGLFLGLDSQDAQIKQLKAKNSELTVSLVEATIIISLLEVRLKSLADLMKHFMDEQERSRDYNETAIE